MRSAAAGRNQRPADGERVEEVELRGAHALGELGPYADHVAVDRQHDKRVDGDLQPPMPAVSATGIGASMCAAWQAAPEQPIAQSRPGGLAVQPSSRPFLGGEAELARDDERQGVEQRHEADVERDLAHFRSSAAVISAAATSTSFLPWSIAVRRRSA